MTPLMLLGTILYCLFNIALTIDCTSQQSSPKTKPEYWGMIIGTIILLLFASVLLICSIPVRIAIAIKKEYQKYNALPKDEDDSDKMKKSREACHKLDMGV